MSFASFARGRAPQDRKYKQYQGLLDRYFLAIKRNVKSVKEKGLYGLEDPPGKPPEPAPPEPPEAG